MRRGFSINGFVFLFALLSLFAGFYYAGGIRSRAEAFRMTMEAQVAQEAIIQYQVALEDKNLVIRQLDSALSEVRDQALEYSWLYRESVKGEAMLRKEFEEYKKSQDSIKAWRNSVPWFSDIPLYMVDY
jgi:hypothetical protein